MEEKKYQSSTLFPVQNNHYGISQELYSEKKGGKRIIISRKQIKNYSLPTQQSIKQKNNIRYSFNVDKVTKIRTISNISETKKHFSPYQTSVKPKKSNLIAIPNPNKNKKQIFSNKTIQMHIHQNDLSVYIEQKMKKLKAYYQDKSDACLIKIKKNKTKKLTHFICPLSRSTFAQ